MTAVLSRLGDLGIAREATPGTWLAPVRFVPVLSPQFEEILKGRTATSRGCPVAVRDVPQPGPDGTLTIRAGSAVERFNRAMARVTRLLYENPPQRPRA